MRLEAYAVLNELDLKQQQRFIEQLMRYQDNEEIMYGLTQSLAILGYKVIEEKLEGLL